ncbi:MAG: TrmH family RNA methyltransferase [Solirubrobacterales bacterium]
MAVRDRIRKVKHLQNKNFICVLEDPRDIVNIASAMRNISAFGVEKLYVIGDNSIVSDFETSRNHKRLNKVSVGANRWVFVRRFDTAAECAAHLRKNMFTIAVTSSHVKGKENVSLYEGTFTQKRLAVWFGNESSGVSDEAVANADLCIEIPMGGIVESLNLGTSTGIILSYISYQRLRFVFENSKVRFKPSGLRSQKMRSWSDFIDPNRD